MERLRAAVEDFSVEKLRRRMNGATGFTNYAFSDSSERTAEVNLLFLCDVSRKL